MLLISHLTWDFFDIQAEPDCLELVKEMKNLRDLCFYSNKILLDCTNLSKKFRTFDLLHVRHEGNNVAHNLANFSLVNTPIIWLEGIPPCTVFALASNLGGS